MPFGLFGKKEDVKKVYIPVDLVLSYASQGLSESEIISRLQSQGFEPEHIDRALRIALREKVTAGIPSTVEVPTQAPLPPEAGPSGPVPMGEVTRRPPIGYPPERFVPPTEPKRVSLEAASGAPFTFERKPIEETVSPMEEITIEEIVEGIVAERWKEFEERLNAFEERDMKLQNQIEDLRRRISDFEGSLKERDVGLSSKLDEFGGSMENIEGRIGSIEKIFKEVLPELSTNIKVMSDLVEKIKEKK